MVKMLELREMIKLVNHSSIQEFNLKNGGVRISMKKPLPKLIEQQHVEAPQAIIQTAQNEAAAALEGVNSQSVTAEPPVKKNAKESPLHTIVSSVIGVFSASTKPGGEPYVKVGDKITADSIVGMCNVAALKLSHEIVADVNGEIVEVLVDEGQIVDFGQPLFIVQPE